MGQCTSHSCVAVHDPSACMSPTPVPERVEKKKRGRVFRWSFSRKSKKTPIEAQQGQSRNDSSQPPQRCSDGEDEQKNNTQSINTPSKNCIVHLLDKAEESRDTNTSVFSHESPFSAVRAVTVDVHRAEENSNTSVYSWHSCESTLNTVQEVDAPRQEQEDINTNNSTSPTVPSNANNSTSPTVPSNGNNSTSPTVPSNGNNSTSPTVPSNGNNSTSPTVPSNGNNSTSPTVPSNGNNSTSPTVPSNGNNSTSPTVPSNGNNSTSPTVPSNGNNSTSPTVPSNGNNSTSPTVPSNGNNSTSPTVSSITKGDLNAPWLSDDNFWKTEDEIINLSSNAKTGNINQDYEIGRLLGQGGFGKVFEGMRLSDSRKVALKYVVKEECYENERLSIFGKALPNEVAMMIRVSEGPSVPQIIKLLDWYETRKEYILVIERPAPCKDLRQYLVQNGGRISESKAQVVMHQAVTAARTCFEKGVFHSDIKIENLLINENSLQVKLIDFGVSRSFKTYGYTRYIGTKLYAPPEAFRRTWRYHAKPATVYSLGVLLFVMLFGKYPYKVKPEVIADILRKAGISKESKELISSCMETDPTKRIDLDKILDHDWFQVLLLEPESQNEEPIVSEFPCVDSYILRKMNPRVLGKKLT
ncbi:Serine/threonine-protein kinase pim-2 [Anabarilius grahami]|uniref:non-specific serine/threonine protein kinase n=1 Tax=Anabarilius grahami TaxID=495550 RepID=A0A3N0YEN2_ANAGA|nr:Serine/threonine-protein kinase pim-2 [Anabarilius grahami]